MAEDIFQKAFTPHVIMNRTISMLPHKSLHASVSLKYPDVILIMFGCGTLSHLVQ